MVHKVYVFTDKLGDTYSTSSCGLYLAGGPDFGHACSTLCSAEMQEIFSPYFDHHSNAEPKCLSLASSLNWRHLRPRVKRTPSFQPLWTWNLGTLTHSDKNRSISYKLNCAEVNSLVSNTFLYTYFRTIFFVQKIEENCVFNLPEPLNVVTLSLFIITSLSFHCCFTLDKDRLSNGLPNKVK